MKRPHGPDNESHHAPSDRLARAKAILQRAPIETDPHLSARTLAALQRRQRRDPWIIPIRVACVGLGVALAVLLVLRIQDPTKRRQEPTLISSASPKTWVLAPGESRTWAGLKLTAIHRTTVDVAADFIELRTGSLRVAPRADAATTVRTPAAKIELRKTGEALIAVEGRTTRVTVARDGVRVLSTADAASWRALSVGETWTAQQRRPATTSSDHRTAAVDSAAGANGADRTAATPDRTAEATGAARSNGDTRAGNVARSNGDTQAGNVARSNGDTRAGHDARSNGDTQADNAAVADRTRARNYAVRADRVARADQLRRRGHFDEALRIYHSVARDTAAHPYDREYATLQRASIWADRRRPVTALRALTTIPWKQGALIPERVRLAVAQYLSLDQPDRAADVLDRTFAHRRAPPVVEARVRVAEALIDRDPVRAATVLDATELQGADPKLVDLARRTRRQLTRTR